MSQSSRSSTVKRALKRRIFNQRETAPCCFCRTPLTMITATLEHILPLSKGGRWLITNLKVSCVKCNAERKDTDFTEFQQKKRNVRSPNHI